MPTAVLFLFSDTGGGHRASATAVARALDAGFPGRYQVDLLDPFVDGSSPFLRWLVYRYGWLIKHLPPVYGAVYHVTDSRPVTRAAIRIFGGQLRHGLRDKLEQRRPAGIVSFHALTNHAVIEEVRDLQLEIPFITVVTDMTDLHQMWMARGADMVVVASARARQFCLDQGLDPRKVFIAGLPVDARFTGPLSLAERAALRRRLGLADSTTLLLTSGGEGSSRLYRYARALDNAGLGLQLVVICGRHQRLQRQLAAERWKSRVTVLGFVDNMPELMQAADAIVSKAGPGTITEALISGLPIFLTGYVPGQEEGNVKFVLQNHVGWYTPRPRRLVRAVRQALGAAEEFQRMKGRAEMVARRGAADEIARLIAAAIPAPPGAAGGGPGPAKG